MKLHQLSFAAAAFVVAAFSAQATTVTLSNVTGTWFGANPAANITSNTGTGTNTSIRWDASGYDFFANTPVSAVLPPNPSADFVLGVFQHVNQPIFTSIDSVRLRVSANVEVDGVSQGVLNFVYQFLHNETPNLDDPCADGNPNNVGVNRNGCADNVRVSFLDGSDTFIVGGEAYTINISGFLVGGNKVNSFWTAERETNRAELLANVIRRSDLQVPEPGTFALVGLALMAAGAAVRRKA